MHVKTCELICNKESGKGITDKELESIINILKNKGYEANLYLTKRKDDAKEHIQELEEKDLVLSIGGDGTFNEVVSGNVKRKKPLLLSHIPVGTTNDFGHMIGLNKNVTKSVEKILDGEIKQVDLGMINNKPFVYVAGFGKFINVPYQTSRKLQKTFGHLAYLINGAKEFFGATKLYELEYTINGNKYHGFYSLILVSNANRIAGLNNIYKDVKLDDDRFEVMFCNITRRKDLAKTFALIMKDGIKNVPGIYFYTTNEFEIKFKEKIKNDWTIDGEKLIDEQKNYKFTIYKDLKLLLPKKNLKKLFLK